jgi:Fe-S-cluster containining protein
MSLIRLKLNRFGHVELSFVNARLLRRVLRVVVRNGGPNEPTAYLQHDGDVESLLQEFPAATRRDLEAGWEVCVRMDPWYAASYYGFEAHTVFEHIPMNNYPCENCGLCCEHLLVEADAFDVLREPKIETAYPLKYVSGQLSVHDACWILGGPDTPCAFLTRQKRCRIYPTRPHTCVAFLAGSGKCEELRQEHGLPPAPAQRAIHDILTGFIKEVIAEEMGEPG